MRVDCQTFEEFQTFARKFGQGYFDLLIVIGTAGLSKTRTMQIVAPEAKVISGGNLSAFGFFLQLYENRNKTLILDDIDGLYSNKDSVQLLKAVCQTEKTKTLGWYTASKKLPLDEHGSPVNEFSTTSQICIIANEWRNLNRNVAAVADRGILLCFEPSACEVHKQVKVWFDDKEILGFFEKHLNDIHEPSMRTYIVARDLKRAGMDWQFHLQKHWGKAIEPELAMLKLRKMKGVAEEEKVKLFTKWCGASRATYFRMKKELAD